MRRVCARRPARFHGASATHRGATRRGLGRAAAAPGAGQALGGAPLRPRQARRASGMPCGRPRVDHVGLRKGGFVRRLDGRETTTRPRMSRPAGERPAWTPGSGEVEPVEVHDLVPRGDEVTHELLIRVSARVDLRDGPKLGPAMEGFRQAGMAAANGDCGIGNSLVRTAGPGRGDAQTRCPCRLRRCSAPRRVIVKPNMACGRSARRGRLRGWRSRYQPAADALVRKMSRRVRLKRR
jgi:hypothetical protein